MESINVNEIALVPSWHEGRPEAKWASCLPFTPMFPTWSGIETKNSSIVYFEIEAGNQLGEHSDSVEELLLVLDGDIEVTIAEETAQAPKGTIIVIPAMVPHKVRNMGGSTAKCIGFFPTKDVGNVFTDTVQPFGLSVFPPEQP
ncbi:cupin domain-containing protein [Sporosarcina sp. 179-K 3D1 HS]|uniref:cupin domain-containing protein n=1 Tax=Sporosarcina sp. 179-K 3D1 HS TaxID=3232169 RepID=UPI0039A08D69